MSADDTMRVSISHHVRLVPRGLATIMVTTVGIQVGRAAAPEDRFASHARSVPSVKDTAVMAGNAARGTDDEWYQPAWPDPVRFSLAYHRAQCWSFRPNQCFARCLRRRNELSRGDTNECDRATEAGEEKSRVRIANWDNELISAK